MHFTNNTPRANFTIAGKTFTAPEPFAEGHKITAGEAASLNQTLRENTRNNLAAKVAADNTFTLDQTSVDAYVADYEFGTTGGGGGARLDAFVKHGRDFLVSIGFKRPDVGKARTRDELRELFMDKVAGEEDEKAEAWSQVESEIDAIVARAESGRVKVSFK